MYDLVEYMGYYRPWNFSEAGRNALGSVHPFVCLLAFFFSALTANCFILIFYVGINLDLG